MSKPLVPISPPLPQLSVVVQQDYAECESNRLGDFAVYFLEDEYGWTLPTPFSCAFVMVGGV